MNKWKKTTLLFLALLTTLSLAVVTGCNKDTGKDTSSSSSSSVDEGPQTPDDEEENDELYTRWVRVTAPTCTEDGVKERTLLEDPTQKQTKAIPKRGHEYADTNDKITLSGGLGKCIRCGEQAEIPALPAGQTFPEANGTGSGSDAYSPLVLNAGCYTLDVNGDLWVAFAVEGSAEGQYAFYSVDGAAVSATRHIAAGDALHPSYVNTTGVAAVTEGGNFYSYVLNSEQTLALFHLQSSSLKRIKICYTKIAETPWIQGNEMIKVYPTELTKGKAEDGPEGKALKDVPYDAEYFYDTATGYYRLGTKEYPGEIIYVKLTKSAERVFSDGGTFVALNTDTLTLSYGENADGDICSYNYVPFMLNWKNDDAVTGGRPLPEQENTTPEADPDKKCYQNYCNADGAYPVNKELYKFLNLYLRRNKPMDEDLSQEMYSEEIKKDFENPEEDNKLWLAACYYYEEYVKGTERYPLSLPEGETTVTTVELDDFFCVTQKDAFYTITWSNPDVYIRVGDCMTPFIGSVTLAPYTKFGVYEANGLKDVEVTLTVEKVAGGSADSALTLTAGSVTLSTVTAYDNSGEQVHYAYYSYTATAAGNLTLTTSEDLAEGVSVKLGSVAVANKTATVTLAEGDTVTVYIVANSATSVTATLSLS